MERILFAASVQGNFRAVKQCIDKGVDVNFRAPDRQTTAVFCASEYGHSDIVELLFKSGADLNVRDCDAWTALMYASQHGREMCVLTLIANGADVHILSRDSACCLILGVQQNHVSIVQHIIKAMHSEPEKMETPICNAFIWSIFKNHHEFFDLFLEAGASVNVGFKHDSDNGSALILAARLGHNDLVRKLIDAGADINYAPFGKTALEEAMPKTRSILIKAGAIESK